MQNDDGTLAVEREQGAVALTPTQKAERLVAERIALIEKAKEMIVEGREILEKLGHVEPEPKKGRPEGAKDKAPRKPRATKAPEVQPLVAVNKEAS